LLPKARIASKATLVAKQLLAKQLIIVVVVAK
jgi:hypothetical protein